MKRDEPEASVVVAEEDSDDNGAAPHLTAAREPAATAKQHLKPPLLRPRPPPPPPPSRSPQIPASFLVSPACIEALANSGPLAPTPATISAVAADERLVSLLDDDDVMASVSRLSLSQSRSDDDSELLQRELLLLSKDGKAGALLELYRRMAAVAAKRCEAFCGEEEREKREQQGGKGEGCVGGEEERREGRRASPLFAAGFLEREPRQQQQQQQPRTGIEVLR